MGRTTVDFGIDLGTTNSSIAVFRGGIDPEVFKNNVNQENTPSVVWINDKGSLFVGDKAKQNIGYRPNDAYGRFKLMMGRPHKYHFAASGRQMTPEELSAEVLKQLRGDVKQRTLEDVIAAVISVPAAFEIPQCEATKRAAQLAGLSYCILIQEPTAAALAYGFGSEHDRAFWMVYDIGGGTFDAAIVRLNEGQIQVVNHSGDNYLGGGNIDSQIVEQLLAPAVKKEYALSHFEYSNAKWTTAFAHLKDHAEKAKIELSRSEVAIINIEDLAGEHEKRMSFEYELHRRDIELIFEPLVRKSVGICKQALAEKKLSPDNIAKMILVGGPTLTPILRDIISNELGIPLDFRMDPLTVVARGAAIFAGTQRMPEEITGSYITPGQYSLELAYEPIGYESEPSIGGRVISPEGKSLKDFTVEFVESKGEWQSGRIPLDDNGKFITTVRAGRERANEFLIELRDSSGNIHGINPDRFTYTIGAVISKPILTHSVGLALANNEMRVLAKKGDELPYRSPKSINHTTIALRKGESGTCLVIPLVEGNNLSHADRNLQIGTLQVPGNDIPYDLPVGSEVEITMDIDESRIVSCEAFIPLLDKIFPAETRLGYYDIDPQKQAVQLETQRARVEELRTKAEETDNKRAKEVLNDIDAQDTINEIEASLNAAQANEETGGRCQKEIVRLQNNIDIIEDELEWPSRISEAKGRIEGGRQVVDEHGTSDDKRKFKSLVSEIRESISSHEPDLLSQKMEALDSLVMPLLLQQPGFWVGWFNLVVEKEPYMKDRSLAKQLITQGRRAIDANDLDGLQAVVRQLIGLLPADEQQEVRGYGSTII